MRYASWWTSKKIQTSTNTLNRENRWLPIWINSDNSHHKLWLMHQLKLLLRIVNDILFLHKSKDFLHRSSLVQLCDYTRLQLWKKNISVVRDITSVQRARLTNFSLAGNWNSLTSPWSSPVAKARLVFDKCAQFTSALSAFFGHIPTTSSPSTLKTKVRVASIQIVVSDYTTDLFTSVVHISMNCVINLALRWRKRVQYVVSVVNTMRATRRHWRLYFNVLAGELQSLKIELKNLFAGILQKVYV